MIEYIEIKNFKSIENLKIPGLKRVNLISGRNNTGKSSVLEALVLYGYEWSPKGLLKVLGNRRRVPYSELQLYDIRSLFNCF
jgi:predicted ATPase